MAILLVSRAIIIDKCSSSARRQGKLLVTLRRDPFILRKLHVPSANRMSVRIGGALMVRRLPTCSSHY